MERTRALTHKLELCTTQFHYSQALLRPAPTEGRRVVYLSCLELELEQKWFEQRITKKTNLGFEDNSYSQQLKQNMGYTYIASYPS